MLNLKGVPKKYHDSIYDIYKDADGWWIDLKEDGEYILVGYYCSTLIHEDTKAEAVKALKTYAKKK